MILKYAVLILVLIQIALSYKQYKYHELCPGNKFKTIFDKITNNKPEVKLNEGIQSAALIHYRSNSSTYKKIGSCEFNVKLDNPGSGSGIFVSIKKLKLRENSYSNYGENSCIDFIRFTYKNGTSTRQICGNIETSVNNLIRNFFDETSGEMRVEVSIDTSESFSSSDVGGLEVDLVFTAYTNCYDDFEKVRCSPEKCVSDVFTNDKILNCPPPGCSDESNCVNYLKPQVTYVKKDSSDSSSSAHIIVPKVVVVVVALIGISCFCKKKKTTANSQRSNDDHVEELRPTARSDLDSYLEFQDVRPVPINQQQHRPMPLVPEGYERPMPLVPPMPYERPTPYDRPMPSAPPTGFKDDPPPYDALFAIPKKANV